MSPTATCQDCAWQGPVEQCGPLKNAWERGQPDDRMPAGECPERNASALLDKRKTEMRVVTTRKRASATHFAAFAHAQALMRMMSVA